MAVDQHRQVASATGSQASAHLCNVMADVIHDMHVEIIGRGIEHLGESLEKWKVNVQYYKLEVGRR
mgnify:CR=1 FL=1